MLEVLVVQQGEDEPLGTLGNALEVAGLTPRLVRVFAGESIPSEIGPASGLIVLGGSMGVYEQDRYPFLKAEIRLIENALDREVPVLGLCLGAQLLSAALGAEVRPNQTQEIGWYPVTLMEAASVDTLFQGLPSVLRGFHWHGDVFSLPDGATRLAFSERTPNQVFRFGKTAWGVQFHLEVTEPIIQKWIAANAEMLNTERLTGAQILADSARELPAMQTLAAGVFVRWTAQVISVSLLSSKGSNL